MTYPHLDVIRGAGFSLGPIGPNLDTPAFQGSVAPERSGTVRVSLEFRSDATWREFPQKSKQLIQEPYGGWMRSSFHHFLMETSKEWETGRAHLSTDVAN